MAHIQFNPSLLSSLKDKVIVLTGGSTGIGLATIKILLQSGAKVTFGDISPPSDLEPSQNLKYVSCDVTSYSSILSLFRIARSAFGPISIVIANAGISIPKDPFLPCSDEEIEQEMNMKEIDVNLKGALYVSRIGMHFLREEKGERGGDLVLVSSIAGFKESTGLGVYTASKHGVLGILRGVRVQAEREGIRINAVCPWMTKTKMVKGIESGWRALQLPENEPEDVARSILICCTANRGESESDESRHKGAKLPFWGRILFAAGGESYEIEERLDELEPEWLGRENSRVLEKGQEFLMNGETSWDTERKG